MIIEITGGGRRGGATTKIPCSLHYNIGIDLQSKLIDLCDYIGKRTYYSVGALVRPRCTTIIVERDIILTR